jgi:uncharacterized UPF0160 family protein
MSMLCCVPCAAAMTLSGTEFLSAITGLSDSWWPARSLVADAAAARCSVHPSGKIMVLEHFCPWKDHLFELEQELDIAGSVLYVLYQDSGGSWRVQAVPADPTSFESRKKLPEAWRGLRDEALSALVGVPGAIFIHASGFIGGHATKEGALSMAVQALDMD